MPKKAPSYRKRNGQALVTLTDSQTKRRRDYWLGEFDTSQSRERYHRVIAEWESSNRRWPSINEGPSTPAAVTTVGEVLIAYWRWAQLQYTPSELSSYQSVIRLMRRMYGTTPAERFGPKRLRLLRECMIKGDSDADPPRRPWSRPHINKQVHRLGAIFKWASGQEILPISVYHQLKSIEPLKRGRCDAREPDPIGPAPEWMVNAIRPHVSRQVWAMVELQRLTGARGGELFGLRPIDIDTSDDIWNCELAEHKTAHHGKARTLYFGPKAQAVISPFLQSRPVDAFLLFS